MTIVIIEGMNRQSRIGILRRGRLLPFVKWFADGLGELRS